MNSEFEKYRYVDRTPRRVKLARLAWNLVWLVAFRPTPRGFLHGWRRFLLRRFGARIGVGSKIAPSCFVWAPWNLEMGDYSALGDHVDCYSMDRIVIGSKVAVSQRSFLCTGSHRIDTLLRPLVTKPITIGNHAWVCAEVFVAPGVNIGEGAVVSARSVVWQSLPAWQVCGGHPCVPVKPRVLKS